MTVSRSAEEVARRAEARWSSVSAAIIFVLAALAAFAGVHKATMPQAQVETIDPRRLHISGEFREDNLGTMREGNGSVTVRLIGQQFSFTPACLLVPVDTPVRLRATSSDVVHGFNIQGTNVNTMLVPGYVTDIPTRFTLTGEYMMPCHEFCGVGHEGMWARLRVVSKPDFEAASAGGRASCVAQ